MTTTVITKINQTTKTNHNGSLATLVIWKSVRGMWGKKKIQPLQYQRSARKERVS